MYPKMPLVRFIQHIAAVQQPYRCWAMLVSNFDISSIRSYSCNCTSFQKQHISDTLSSCHDLIPVSENNQPSPRVAAYEKHATHEIVAVACITDTISVTQTNSVSPVSSSRSFLTNCAFNNCQI